MTPTSNQDKELRTYLRKVFVYRETYEEVYDHIISAVNEKPEDISFEQAVNNVINEDFGGHKNLVNIEANSKAAIKKDIRRQQSAYFWSFFKFPNLIYVLIFALVLYRLLALMPLTSNVIRGMFLVLSFLPWLAMPVRYYLTGYLLGDTKRSVKDNAMSNWSMIPFQVFCAGNVLMVINKDYHFTNGLNLYCITVGIVLFAIYTLAFFKLSRAEFKVDMGK
jgi:hypothetical protein